MKVKYIGGESAIGSRETIAYGRKWVIGEVVDMDRLDENYVAQFGAKIAKHPMFEVVEGGEAPKVSVMDLTGIDANVGEVVASGILADAPVPAKTPRKKKTT